MRQIVSLPDAGRLLKIVECHNIFSGGLGTLQIAFLQKLLYQEEKHPWVPIEQVLNLMQRHVVGVTWRLKGALNKIIRTCDRDEILKFREVIRIQLVILDQLSGKFGVLGP